MGKPTKCKTPEEQQKKERRNFLRRMKPKPVLAERIKRREERKLEKQEKVDRRNYE